MPEFRLRRKKDKNKEQQPRRHTVHNDSEMAVQLQEMAMLFQQSEIIFGPNEVVSIVIIYNKEHCYVKCP